MPSMSQRALRRYPALAGFGALGVMALLLPSTLNVPQTGPTTLAEFAPVPGKTMSNIANLTELAPTSSDGIGAGGTGVTTGAAGNAAPATTIATRASNAGKRRAGTKHCVGNPPRQTEDPLSPPCIAFFDGDNGGATAKGVTRDEIRVVFIELCSNGTPETIKDYDSSNDEFGSLVRYLNERFQTYGRRVHAWWYEKECLGEAGQRALMREIDERIDPFAVINLGAPDAMADEAAALGIWTNLNGASRAAMAQRAPYLRSFAPDQEDWMANAAAFLCAKLAGRPARYSGEPTAQSATRKFAVHYQSLWDPSNAGLPRFLNDVRSRCGDMAGEFFVESAGGDPSVDIARWREAGVTTVVNIGQTLDPPVLAANQGWFPEWFFVPDYFSNARYRGLYSPAEMANAFAITPARRLAERTEDRETYQTSKASCPSCRVLQAETYDETLLFFRGIQAAGPRLTIESVDRGLHAIPKAPSLNPWTPAAYFAPGNWTFVKDTMLTFWDPLGSPPGGTAGCWRAVEYGKRYRTEDWASAPGDDNFKRFAEWPCHGEG
jgi:hypothetical protein